MKRRQEELSCAHREIALEEIRLVSPTEVQALILFAPRNTSVHPDKFDRDDFHGMTNRSRNTFKTQKNNDAFRPTSDRFETEVAQRRLAITKQLNRGLNRDNICLEWVN
jgi:hypothetical protein